MTPADVRKALTALHLTVDRAAAHLGVDAATVMAWLDGRQPVPEPQSRLLLTTWADHSQGVNAFRMRGREIE